MMFKIGDVVRVISEYPSVTRGGIGIIISLGFGFYDRFPYKLHFLDEKHKKYSYDNESPLGSFEESELEKLSEKESVMWLI